MKENFIDAALARRPDQAIVLRGDDGTWTTREVRDAVHAGRERLSAVRVLAVLADNSPAWVLADLAAGHAGVAHLPLPGFASPEQLTHALRTSAADALLTDQPERIEALQLGFERDDAWLGLTLLRRRLEPASLPAGTAKISFTSGSTGHPKGVCLSMACLQATAQAVATRLADLRISRHLSVLPLSLLLENVAGVYAPLLHGDEIVLPGLRRIGWQGMAGFDPVALQDVVQTESPGSLILVPELLKAWTQYLALTQRPIPESLRFVAVGGARVDADLLAQAQRVGVPAYQGYGLTECGSVVSLNCPGDVGDGVGRPLGHVSIRVEADELRIGVPGFLGYLGAADAANGTDGFATGDLGQLDSVGHLHLSGRRKNLLITSYGRNISPEWVESVLSSCPEIRQAVVFGDGRPWLGALIVPAPGIDTADLARAVAGANRRLPDYARVGGWRAVPPFTPLNGQATGNGRPVRERIQSAHATTLATLYQNEETTHAVL